MLQGRWRYFLHHTSATALSSTIQASRSGTAPPMKPSATPVCDGRRQQRTKANRGFFGTVQKICFAFQNEHVTCTLLVLIVVVAIAEKWREQRGVESQSPDARCQKGQHQHKHCPLHRAHDADAASAKWEGMSSHPSCGTLSSRRSSVELSFLQLQHNSRRVTSHRSAPQKLSFEYETYSSVMIRIAAKRQRVAVKGATQARRLEQLRLQISCNSELLRLEIRAL